MESRRLVVLTTLTVVAGKGFRGVAGGKGFGTRAPTLADVLLPMKTRLPVDSSVPCACGSGEPYAECCAPYHRGEVLPAAAERLVRTRYSAFAYRLPAYVVNTTHPLNRDYEKDTVRAVKALDRRGMFDSFEFVELAITSTEEDSSEERFATFTVTLRASKDAAAEGVVKGQELRLRERSRFLPTADGSSWLYAGGEVRALVDGIDDTVLNP